MLKSFFPADGCRRTQSVSRRSFGMWILSAMFVLLTVFALPYGVKAQTFNILNEPDVITDQGWSTGQAGLDGVHRDPLHEIIGARKNFTQAQMTQFWSDAPDESPGIRKAALARYLVIDAEFGFDFDEVVVNIVDNNGGVYSLLGYTLFDWATESIKVNPGTYWINAGVTYFKWAKSFADSSSSTGGVWKSRYPKGATVEFVLKSGSSTVATLNAKDFPIITMFSLTEHDTIIDEAWGTRASGNYVGISRDAQHEIVGTNKTFTQKEMNDFWANSNPYNTAAVVRYFEVDKEFGNDFDSIGILINNVEVSYIDNDDSHLWTNGTTSYIKWGKNFADLDPILGWISRYDTGGCNVSFNFYSNNVLLATIDANNIPTINIHDLFTIIEHDTIVDEAWGTGSSAGGNYVGISRDQKHEIVGTHAVFTQAQMEDFWNRTVDGNSAAMVRYFEVDKVLGADFDSIRLVLDNQERPSRLIDFSNTELAWSNGTNVTYIHWAKVFADWNSNDGWVSRYTNAGSKIAFNFYKNDEIVATVNANDIPTIKIHGIFSVTEQRDQINDESWGTVHRDEKHEIVGLTKTFTQAQMNEFWAGDKPDTMAAMVRYTAVDKQLGVDYDRIGLVVNGVQVGRGHLIDDGDIQSAWAFDSTVNSETHTYFKWAVYFAKLVNGAWEVIPGISNATIDFNFYLNDEIIATVNANNLPTITIYDLFTMGEQDQIADEEWGTGHDAAFSGVHRDEKHEIVGTTKTFSQTQMNDFWLNDNPSNYAAMVRYAWVDKTLASAFDSIGLVVNGRQITGSLISTADIRPDATDVYISNDTTYFKWAMYFAKLVNGVWEVLPGVNNATIAFNFYKNDVLIATVNGENIPTITILKDPEMSDLEVTPTLPTTYIYNGNPQGVSISAANGVNGLGTITTYYEGINGTSYTQSTTVPTNVGEYEVTVDIATGTEYISATGLLIGTYEINRRTTIITDFRFDISPVVYNGTAQSLSVLPLDTLTGMGAITVYYTGIGSTIYPRTTTPPINAGHYDIHITVVEGMNYTAVTGTGFNLGTYIINKKTPTKDDLVFNPTTTVYNGAPQSVMVTAVNGVNGMGMITRISYEGTGSTNYPISTTAPTAVGTYSITVNIDAGANYAAATGIELDGNYSITAKTPLAADFVFTPTTTVYNGVSQAVIATAAGGVTGMGTPITVKYNGSTTVPTNAGTYAVTVDIPAGSNYASATGLALGNYTIAKKVPTTADLVMNPSTNVYNGTARPTGVTSATAGAISNIRYNASNTVPTNVGTYSITVDVASNANYEAVNGLYAGTYNITPATLTSAQLTFTPSTTVYNGAPQAVIVSPAVNVTGVGFVTAVKYNGSITVPDSAGVYAITVDVASGANYANISNLNLGNYTITKATHTNADFDFTIPATNFVYNGLPQGTVVVTPKSHIKGNGIIGTVLYNGLTNAIDAGTYTVTVSVAAGVNYNAASLTLGTFTIDKKSLTAADLDYTPTTVVYNGNPQGTVVTPNISVPNFDGNIVTKYDGNTQEPTDAGVYAITVEIEEGNNYAAVSEFYLGDFTITKDEITISDLTYFIPTGDIYNGLPQGIGNVTCNAAGFTGTVIVKYNSDAQEPVNAGTYAVTVEIVDVNYASEIALGNYTIAKKEVIVKAENDTIEQWQTPTITVTYTGFISPDDEDNALYVKAVAKTVTNTETVGTYVIDFAIQAVLNMTNGANYVLKHENGELEILKATGIKNLTPSVNPLKAYVNNGNLYVSGLTAGTTWNVYSVTGALIYQGVATGDTAETYLAARGMYIIQSENKTLKVVY